MHSTSRRGRQTIHDEEYMDVDGDDFSDKHRLMLQYIMQARMSKKLELSKVQRKLFNNSESLSETLDTLTRKINVLKMDIKQMKSDITGEAYYVLIHTTGDSFFPRCCIFNKSQLEFLKQVLTGIVLSSNGSIGKMQALNSSQLLSKSEADEAIKLFIKEKILVELVTVGKLCLTPLAVVEFEPFFHASLADNLNSCDLCKQLVFFGKICEGNCGQKFHCHCISMWLQSGRNECPQCQQTWTLDVETD